MKKILFASEVKGNFKALAKLSEDYDLTFCVGETCTCDGELRESDFESVVFKKPVFFIESGPMKFPLGLNHPKGGELKRNFMFLGRLGVKTIENFRVFFNSCEQIGLDCYPDKLKRKAPFYSEAEQKEFAEQCMKESAVDIFISNIGPSNPHKFSAVCSQEEFEGSCPSEEFIAKTIDQLAPRFCVFPSNMRYIAREPFENNGKLPGGNPMFTRMVYVPKFLHQTERFLYALKISPMSLKQGEDTETPQNLTKNPFSGI
jgi:hypothetical protein